jgi:hypothetical protein
MSDLLEQATRALRETSAEPNPRSGLTRARILESAEKRSIRRRGFWLRWLIGIVAALGASTALARVAQYWPEIKRAIAPAAEQTEPSASRARKPPRRPAVKPPPVAAEPPAVVEPPAELPPAVVTPLAEPVPAPKPKTPRVKARRPEPPGPVVVAQAPAPAAVAPAPPAESAELALFRRAQRLHLARDPKALDAWDDYLRVADRGALVPEARYNRALCLVRAGHKVEARRALEPFARGEYGDYRRSEAQALLDALSEPNR